MPGHDTLGNDAMVAPAALARAIVPLFVFYTGPDRRVVQGMQDQSIKRGSSVKGLGDRRDAAHGANGRHGWQAAAHPALSDMASVEP